MLKVFNFCLSMKETATTQGVEIEKVDELPTQG